MFKKQITILIISLIALSLASFTVSMAAEKGMTVKGSIVAIDPDIGMIQVVDEKGKTLTLNAGPETDLKTFQKGDEVMIEYDKDKVIKMMDKKG
jgi:hypothetical protein